MLRSDPVTAAWMERLRRDPVPSRQHVLSGAMRLHPGIPLRRCCGWTSSVPTWSSARAFGGCTHPSRVSIAR